MAELTQRNMILYERVCEKKETSKKGLMAKAIIDVILDGYTEAELEELGNYAKLQVSNGERSKAQIYKVIQLTRNLLKIYKENECDFRKIISSKLNSSVEKMNKAIDYYFNGFEIERSINILLYPNKSFL